MQDQAATSPYEVKISAQDVLCSSHYMNSVVLPNNGVTYQLYVQILIDFLISILMCLLTMEAKKKNSTSKPSPGEMLLVFVLCIQAFCTILCTHWLSALQISKLSLAAYFQTN